MTRVRKAGVTAGQIISARTTVLIVACQNSVQAALASHYSTTLAHTHFQHSFRHVLQPLPAPTTGLPIVRFDKEQRELPLPKSASPNCRLSHRLTDTDRQWHSGNRELPLEAKHCSACAVSPPFSLPQMLLVSHYKLAGLRLTADGTRACFCHCCSHCTRLLRRAGASQTVITVLDDRRHKTAPKTVGSRDEFHCSSCTLPLGSCHYSGTLRQK